MAAKEISFSPLSNGNVQGCGFEVGNRAGSEKTVSEIAIPRRYSAVIAGISPSSPKNVRQIYAHLVQDIRDDTHVVPNFADALVHHQLLDAIETASRTGVAQTVG